MRLFLLILSVAFVAYGLLPYNKAKNVDTTKSNQLIVEQQECGCPCPDAAVLKGNLDIPPDITTKYPSLNLRQINLDISDFNEPYNFETGHAKLFITGKVVGADTILCEPANCEIAPRFQVEKWALVDSVARAWTFPTWMAALFLVNLLFAPTLTFIEVKERLRSSKRKSGS